MNIELLRKLVAAIRHEKHGGSTLIGIDAMNWIAGGGLSYVRIDPTTGNRWGLDQVGLAALDELASSVIQDNKQRSRAASSRQLRSALGKLIMERFAGATSENVDTAKLECFASDFDGWWSEQTRSRSYLVPCAIIPAEAPEFRIGPVQFMHWSSLISGDGPLSSTDFGKEQARNAIARALEAASACWVACVQVEGAYPDRAEEIADIAVDLAIVAIQLAVPVAHSRHMSRVTRRTPPAVRGRVVMSEGQFEVGNANQSPGLALSGPALIKFLSNAAEMTETVGRRIANFANVATELPSRVDNAWCEGAYWLHEGLAEHLDSFAVAKLETAIEVLLRGQNAKGSGKRIRQAICAVTGLSEQDAISPGSRVTVATLTKELVRARSQVLHGTQSTLSGDLSSERKSLEGLCHVLFVAAAIGLEQYQGSDGAIDDVDGFLSWLGKQDGS